MVGRISTNKWQEAEMDSAISCHQDTGSCPFFTARLSVVLIKIPVIKIKF